MRFNPKYHNRKSIRLKGYDYSQGGLYFITLGCKDRAHLFGFVENGEMQLNPYGKIAFIEWAATEEIRDNCRIHEQIVMPNHIHGIIEILFKKGTDKSEPKTKFRSPSHTIGSVVRGFKIATIRKIKDYIIEKEGKRKDSEDITQNTGELSTGELSKGELSMGELQFAPTTKKIIQLNFKIWQRNYYEHIIRDEKAYQNISKYIINNPKNWKEDKFYNR